MERAERTERELLRRTASGDGEALADLYGKYNNKVFRIALLVTANREDAKDVTQEVFIRLAQGAAAIREVEKLGPWLHRVTVNCSIDLLKRKGRLVSKDVLEEQASHESPERYVLDAEKRRYLLAGLAKLPEKQRTAVVLRFFEGMRIEQIAGELGLTSGSTRVTIARALKSLRRRLARMKGLGNVRMLRLDGETR